MDSSSSPEQLEKELSRLTHDLMGGISALLMCEHMVAKELEAYPDVQNNEAFTTTMSLLKETAVQIREFGDQLMTLSHQFQVRAGLRQG